MQAFLVLAAAFCGGVSAVKAAALFRPRFPSDRLENLITKIKLPGCLSYARNLALVSKLTEADTADSVLTEVGVGSTTDLASVVSASRELRFSLLLKYHGLLCHSFSS